jgi:APA family basic amino acid/polyamine antiporter
VSIGTLLAFVLVSLGVIILRRTAPTFRALSDALEPLLPIAGAVVCLAQMAGCH